ncbi:hypothetical protein [Caldimonas tepidiphila]|uniref:hypothetical protein n=1 Tax=Caldimonas tepidiphila TaxID=2315841 RepID=UPI000E5A91CD|nr:hypothetical protein [Caldimonas tepidiphila]
MPTPQDDWIDECAARLRELVPELDEATARDLAGELWEEASGVMEPAEAAEMEMRVRLQESAGTDEDDEAGEPGQDQPPIH